MVFLALAPLWHFMPTKRQRQQATLRETAAVEGLFVEFRDLPLPDARLARLPPAERQVLYYGCRFPAKSREPRERLAWLREGQQWGAVRGRSPLPKLALELPEGVLGMEVGRASCGVYWREEGGEDDVRELARILTSWRDQLSPPREVSS